MQTKQNSIETGERRGLAFRRGAKFPSVKKRSRAEWKRLELKQLTRILRVN